MNKDTVQYFMSEMSQKEFEERNKDKVKCTYEFNRIQPERSKREDHILVYKDENGNKTPIRDLFNPNYGCGALNTMET